MGQTPWIQPKVEVKKNKDYVQTNKHTQARIDKQAQIGYNRIMKDIKQLEKEIIKSLAVNVNVNWDAGENNPSEEFDMLIDHVKRLFKKYA